MPQDLLACDCVLIGMKIDVFLKLTNEGTFNKILIDNWFFWSLLSVIFWLTKCFSYNFVHGRKPMGLFHDFKRSSSQPLLSYIAFLSFGTSTCANTVSRWFSMVWFPLRSFTSLIFLGLASDPNSDVKAWQCRREDRLIYFGFPLTVLNAQVCSWLLPE